MVPSPRSLRRSRPVQNGFLLPLSTAASLLLMLSSLSLQAAALQSRSQVSAGQRLRQAEDGLMSAAQHLLADPLSVDQLAARVGETGQVGPVAYRLVSLTGPSWQDTAEAGAPANAARGQTFFNSRHGGEWSCASCHGQPPTADGKLDAVALAGSNQMELRVFANPGADHALLVARLDNLGKGASGAAVQNLELMLGL